MLMLFFPQMYDFERSHGDCQTKRCAASGRSGFTLPQIYQESSRLVDLAVKGLPWCVSLVLQSSKFKLLAKPTDMRFLTPIVLFHQTLLALGDLCCVSLYSIALIYLSADLCLECASGQ